MVHKINCLTASSNLLDDFSAQLLVPNPHFTPSSLSRALVTYFNQNGVKSYQSELRCWNSYLEKYPKPDQWTTNSLHQYLVATQTASTTAHQLVIFAQSLPVFQINTALHNFLLALESQHCSQATIRNYRSDINQFFAFRPQNSLRELITKPNIQSFLKNQKESGLQPASVRRKLVALIQFGLWLEQHQYIPPVSSWLRATTQQLEIKNTIKKPDTNSSQKMVSSIDQPTVKTKRFAWPFTQKKPIFKPKLSGVDNKPLTAARLDTQVRSQITRQLMPWLTIGMIAIFATGVAVFGARQFISQAVKTLANVTPSSLKVPNNVLSFQGRLTDIAKNPITSATNVTFKLYDNVSGGSVLWNSGTCSITPDQDGIFTANLGSDCGASIGTDVFANNTNVWLEVQVAAETLTPRQPIRSVAYALNSATLQGYPASASATRNTVLVMDNTGSVVLNENNPNLTANNGTFTVTAPVLTLGTKSGSNGNIYLTPDGTGKLGIGVSSVGSGTAKLAIYGGSVGIGTSSPSYALDINGGLGVGGTANFTSNVGIGQTASSYALGVGGNVNLLTGNAYYIAGTSVLDATTLGNGVVNSSLTKVGALTSGSIASGFGSINNGGNSIVTTGIMGSYASTTHLGLAVSISGNLGVGGTAYINTLGVGTTSPGAKLDVVGGTRISTILAVGGSELGGAQVVDIRKDSTTAQLVIAGTTQWPRQLQLGYNTTGNYGTIQANELGTGYTNLALNPNGGNVGIGTTAPSQTLHVAGSARITGALYDSSNSAGSSTNVLTSTGTGTAWTNLSASLLPSGTEGQTLYNNAGTWTANSGLFYDDVNSRVGIGTTSPGAKLEVLDSGAGVVTPFRITNSQLTNGSGAGISLYATSIETARIESVITGASTDLRFYNYWGGPGLGEKMRITFNGNVGIGTTSPGARLAIQGSSVGGYNSTRWGQSSDMAIRSSEMTDGAYHSILQLVSIRESLSAPARSSNGYLGFTTVDDSNAEGVDDAGRIAIVNEYGNQRNSSTALSFWTNTGGTVGNAATEQVRITSSGNVGIGTTAPSYKLDVNGGLGVGGTANFTSNVGIGQTASSYALGVGGNVNLLTGNAYYIAGTSVLDATTLGNGVVNSSLTKVGALNSGSISTGFGAIDTGADNIVTTGIMGSYASTTHLGLAVSISGNLGVGGTAWFMQNVGVGTSSPEANLHIKPIGNASLKIESTGSSAYLPSLELRNNTGGHSGYIYYDYFGGNVNTGNPAGIIYKSGRAGFANHVFIEDDGTFQMIIKDGGNVGIGTTAPSQTLHVAGSARITGALYDSSNSAGSSTNVLTSTGTGTAWTNLSASLLPSGTEGQTLYNNAGTWTANSGLFYDDVNSRVGIGTTGPGAKLDVRSSDAVLARFKKTTASSEAKVEIANDNYTWYTGLIDGRNFAINSANSTLTPAIFKDTGDVIFNAGNVGIGTTSPLARLGVIGADSLNTSFAGNISGATGTGLVITNAGNVGIGTTGPSEKLTLWGGEASVTGADLNGTMYLKNNASEFALRGNITGKNLYLATGNRTADITIQGSSGNVGIGTTAPSQTLHVAGSARITGALYDSSNSAGSSTNVLTSTGTGTAWSSSSTLYDTTYFKQGGNSFTAIGTLGTNDAYNLAFETNNSTRMTIDNSGRVGIGTTNPNKDIFGTVGLDVRNGKIVNVGSGSSPSVFELINTNASAGSGLQISYGNGTSHNFAIFNNSLPFASSHLIFQTQSAEHMRITGDGLVGIGTTAPSYKLDVNGGLGVGGTANFTSNVGIGQTASSYALGVGGNVNLLSGNAYYIAGTSVLDATTLGNGVVNSSLTKVGALNSGSISTGFGAIDTGADNIVTTGIMGSYASTTHLGLAVSISGNLGVGGTAYINTLGVGTTTPTQPLHVAGNMRLTGDLYDQNNQPGSDNWVLTSMGTGVSWTPLSAITSAAGWTDGGSSVYLTTTSDSVGIGSSSTGTAKLVVAGGSVGIGTSSPGYALDINGGLGVGGTANFTSNVGIGQTASSYALGVGGNVNLLTGNAYYIAGTSVLDATTLGNGVVNSSLTKVGALNSGSISTGFGAIDTGADNIVTTGTMGSYSNTSFLGAGVSISGNLGVGGTARFVGNVGIGQTANGSYSLGVTGAANFTGTVTAGDFSCSDCLGQGDIGASAVGQGELKTATSSTAGTGNLDVAMNDYSFFPSIEADDCDDTSGQLNVFLANATNDTVGRFRIINMSCVSGSFDIRWRYVTASDHPTIWTVVNAGGTIANVWQSEDPVNPEEYPANPNPFIGTSLKSGQRFASVKPLTVTQLSNFINQLSASDQQAITDLLRNYIVNKRGWLSSFDQISDLEKIESRYYEAGRFWAMRFIAQNFGIDPAELIVETTTVNSLDELVVKPTVDSVISGHLAQRNSTITTREQKEEEKKALPDSVRESDVSQKYLLSSGVTAVSGDIVAINSANGLIEKATKSGDEKLIGVVSTSSEKSLGGDKYGDVDVSISGRVPVKVSSANGNIAPGDPITSSGVAGIGTKATNPGYIIGRALESYSNADTAAVGKILVFINLGYFDPNLGINPNGDISLKNNTWITARNAADSADINLIKLSQNNNVQLGTTSLEIPTTNLTTISFANPAAQRTYLVPDFGSNDTFVGLNATQTLNNKSIGSSGLIFNNAVNDITTPSSEHLTLAPGGNSSSARVNIGDQNTTDTDLLVLDYGTSDPTGIQVNGATYYNSTNNKFRCYEGGAWKDCIFSGFGAIDTGAENIVTTGIMGSYSNTSFLGAGVSISGNLGVGGTANFTGNVGIGQTASSYALGVGGNVNLLTGNAYYIAGTSVLDATTLGNNVVNSSLTKVGALTSGSIASGFGAIDTGADNIVTTGIMGSYSNTSFLGAGVSISRNLGVGGTAWFRQRVGIGNSSPGVMLDLGLAGNTAGVMRFAGSGSGNVTLGVAASAGVWTMTLPNGAGNSGQQLQTNGSGVTSWAAAGSQRELKNINGVADYQDALDKILKTTVYNFHYKPGMGTLDSDTQYVGVMADESSWAMHHNGTIVNPVNTLGYAVLGIQGVHKEYQSLLDHFENNNSMVASQVSGLTSTIAYWTDTVSDLTQSIKTTLTTGLVQTQNLVVNQLANINQLNVKELTIDGQKLADYIKNNISNTNIADQPIITPSPTPQPATSSALADLLVTDTLTAQNIQAETIQVQNTQAQNLEVSGQTALGELIVSGDASVGGELTVQSARIAQLEAGMAQLSQIKATTAELVEATVSGTLYADNIANLDQQIADAFSQPSLKDLLNVSNSSSSSTSASLDQLYAAVISTGIEATSSADGQTNQSLIDVSLPENGISLRANAAYLTHYFEVNGTAFVADMMGIGGKLRVGTQMEIGYDYIALHSDHDSQTLKIQPSGQGRIELLAGLMTLDQTGQVEIKGSLAVQDNLTVGKTLLTGLIQPVDFGNPFQVQVAGLSTQSGELKQSRFEIVNELGAPVATISATGQAQFAGGIGVGSENLGAPPSSESAQLQANKTAGTAVLTAGTTELTINNNVINDQSIVQITPQGSTQNQVIYVKSKTAHSNQNTGRFVVGIDTPVTEDIHFSWWIVQ